MSITPIARCPGNPKAWLRCATSIGVQAGCGGCTLNCPPISQAACGLACGPSLPPINQTLCSDGGLPIYALRLGGILPKARSGPTTGAICRLVGFNANDPTLWASRVPATGTCPGTWPFSAWVLLEGVGPGSGALRTEQVGSAYAHSGFTVGVLDCVRVDQGGALPSDPSAVIGSVRAFNHSLAWNGFLAYDNSPTWGDMAPCDAGPFGGSLNSIWGNPSVLYELSPLVAFPSAVGGAVTVRGRFRLRGNGFSFATMRLAVGWSGAAYAGVPFGTSSAAQAFPIVGGSLCADEHTVDTPEIVISKPTPDGQHQRVDLCVQNYSRRAPLLGSTVTVEILELSWTN